ncbi:MAG TPA: sugar phosphate nucleotidyltransferase [Candidatus Eisenbacteria bacterium]|nr:sugar phosphate nucleotidyltransferase [Candidatus Eisenbacteria bacterium]
MQAVILVAGQSRRFYPYTSYGHKSMVPLMGKPLLQHTLESLKEAKIANVVIVVGKDSMIPERLEKISGLHVTFVEQNESLGMGNALLQAESVLEESFFLLSGYHLEVADFTKDLLKKQKNKDDVVLLAKEDSILERYGVLKVEGDTVLSLTERPTVTEGAQLRVVSIYLLNKTFLHTLKGIPTEQYHFEKALDTYAKNNSVRFVKTDSLTITLKHSWDLLTVKEYLLSKMKRSISSKASVAKSAIIEGNVFIADNVKILEGACIKGPCFLGQGVVVGNNAILRNGVVAEEQAVIGANLEVKNTILMQHATTHNGFIGDSVVGQYTRLAGGFYSANVRFDRGDIVAKVRDESINTHKKHIGVMVGEYVDTGVGVTTMPGVSIGNHVTIGPSTMISENVEDNTLIYAKFQTVVKKKSIR